MDNSLTYEQLWAIVEHDANEMQQCHRLLDMLGARPFGTVRQRLQDLVEAHQKTIQVEQQGGKNVTTRTTV